jgi:type IV secretion system protein VirB11
MDTISYAGSVIDVIVQLKRDEGKRGIAAIARASDLVETWS